MTKILIFGGVLLAGLFHSVCGAETETDLQRVIAMYMNTPADSPFRKRLFERMLELGFHHDDEDICPEMLTDIVPGPLPPPPRLSSLVTEAEIYKLDSFDSLRQALIGFDDRGAASTPDAVKIRSTGLQSVMALLQSGQMNSLTLSEEARILIVDVVFYSANHMLFRLMTGIDERSSDPFLNLENALMTDRYKFTNQRLRFELWTALYAGAGRELFAMFPDYFADRLERLADMSAASGLRFIPQYGPHLRGEVGGITDHAGIYPRILQKMLR